MNMKQCVEWELAGETEVLGENKPECNVFHHKFHKWSDLGSNPGPRGGKPATNNLSYGTATDVSKENIAYIFSVEE
jgi:hypothetical protein